MIPNSFATLALVAAVTGVSSFAFRTDAHPDLIGGRDVQITLQRGQAYMIPLPATAYPGAPIRVEIADENYNSRAPYWGALMANTISYSGGSISWNNSLFGSGQAFQGQTVTVDLLGALGSGAQDALLQAIPVGSGEGLQLSAPSTSKIASQTFVIRVSN